GAGKFRMSLNCEGLPLHSQFSNKQVMILYNVTVNVDADVHDEWLEWMKEIHMVDVLATGMFVEGKLARILAEEEGGKAYSIQYFARSMDDYGKYLEDFAPKLQAEHERKFSGKVASFRTLLHVVQQVNEKG